jgi:hypothetical protein
MSCQASCAPINRRQPRRHPSGPGFLFLIPGILRRPFTHLHSATITVPVASPRSPRLSPALGFSLCSLNGSCYQQSALCSLQPPSTLHLCDTAVSSVLRSALLYCALLCSVVLCSLHSPSPPSTIPLSAQYLALRPFNVVSRSLLIGILIPFGLARSSQCSAVLCCALLCSAVLRCALLCCAVLRCAVLCCAALCSLQSTSPPPAAIPLSAHTLAVLCSALLCSSLLF